MKVYETKRYEEITVLLVEGEDYSQEDLEPHFISSQLFNLKQEKLTELAKKYGYDKWSFSGFHNNNQYTDERKLGVVAAFKKEI